MPRFSHARSVLFQEVDAAGIVFFARFFEWFHDAYCAHLAERGLRFEALIPQQTWGLPLAHAEADYKLPLTYAIPIRVDIETLTLGESSMTVTYAVRGEAGQVHAVGKTVHVCIDRKTFRPRPFPPDVVAALS